jgi:predicted dienelactone hydrolase
MSARAALVFAAAAAVAVATCVRAEDYKAEPGPFTVEIERGTWTDAARDGREVPWKAYLPKAGATAPVVVWSHGLGGSREGAEYLGRHLASHGYAAFHLQHAGSDAAVANGGRQALAAATRDPAAALERFRDVPFAVARLEALATTDPWRERIDIARIGMSGHSYGAITTMVAAGQAIGPAVQRIPVPQIRGAFVMSPSPPRNLDAERAYAGIAVPLFHLTGTGDSSPLDANTKSADRRLPFDRITEVDQYLLVLKDGLHLTFSGRRDQPYPRLERHHAIIRMAAVAFWDTVLRNDPAAREWLEGGGFARAVGNDGTVEIKRAKHHEGNR